MSVIQYAKKTAPLAFANHFLRFLTRKCSHPRAFSGKENSSSMPLMYSESSVNIPPMIDALIAPKISRAAGINQARCPQLGSVGRVNSQAVMAPAATGTFRVKDSCSDKVASTSLLSASYSFVRNSFCLSVIIFDTSTLYSERWPGAIHETSGRRCHL